MDKGKLTDKEKALLAEARREAAARKDPLPAAPTPGETRSAPPAKPAPTPAERLAQLMEDERAETLQRKKKMRRYGIGISGAILALFALWVLRASRRR
jgi:hypothetical protein